MVSALSSNMTIEAWINPTIVANIWMPVIGKSLNGSQFRYVLQGVTPQNGAPSVFITRWKQPLLSCHTAHKHLVALGGNL